MPAQGHPRPVLRHRHGQPRLLGDRALDGRPRALRQLRATAASCSRRPRGSPSTRQRKKEALNKLDATEGDLLRVNDIVFEIERELGSLARQVAKARRYQRLRDEIRDLDLRLVGHAAPDRAAAQGEASSPSSAQEEAVRREGATDRARHARGRAQRPEARAARAGARARARPSAALGEREEARGAGRAPGRAARRARRRSRPALGGARRPSAGGSSASGRAGGRGARARAPQVESWRSTLGRARPQTRLPARAAQLPAIEDDAQGRREERGAATEAALARPVLRPRPSSAPSCERARERLALLWPSGAAPGGAGSSAGASVWSRSRPSRRGARSRRPGRASRGARRASSRRAEAAPQSSPSASRR